jgi:prepilin-type N-terminal cleavage/methylation domain-containing protein
MPVRRSDSSGFTLIEVLVGLVLFGLLVLTLTGAVRLGLVGSVRVETAAAAVEERRITAGLFERLIRRSEPWPDWSDREARVAFAGNSQSVGFVAVLPSGLGGGLGLIRFELADRRLVAQTCPLALAETGLRCAETALGTVLADDVRALGFAYLGAPAPDAPARWLDVWEERPALPLAVRLQVATGRGAWPALIARPAIEAVE